MDFYAVLDQIVTLLQQRGRVSYRALKLQFQLDDEQLEAVKEELIEAQRTAIEEDGKVLTWRGAQRAILPMTMAPVTQTPPSSPSSLVSERLDIEQKAIDDRTPGDGERKTITALFADLKGSTALIERLDPEDARVIIDPALQIMMDAVHRYEGYVAQVLGDGIFALFGAPIAHEDHPQRALYAALQMQETMRRHSDSLRLKRGFSLSLRVGINTGEVIVRSIRKDDLHTDYVPVGHSTNLAARMEQMATPGSILITEYTKKLTEGFFDLKALGAAEIKGVENPLPVYEVLGVGSLRTRLQVAERRGLTRFVGRYAELEQVLNALEKARAGYGQILSVIGEPGLGKSRLFHEFTLTLRNGCLMLETSAVSHNASSPYWLLIELLKTYFQLLEAEDERTRRERVLGKVLGLDRGLEDTLPYLYALLGIEEASSVLSQMDPQLRRRRTFAAVKRLLFCESLKQPVILLVEDLHWIDSETQEFLDVLSEGMASTRLFLFVNYRPEYRHEWGQKTYYTQIRLTPLDRAEAEELLAFLLGNDASLKSVKQQILVKTEGSPFFIEEVIQTLVDEHLLKGERGHYRLQTEPSILHLSPTVQGVLAARIDRLGSVERQILQYLAVLGREFSLSLVRSVIPQSEEELSRSLSFLQHKEFLYEQPNSFEVGYRFKHALTHEVAYNTVLQDRRKVLHEQTAQAIETLYVTNLEEHYGELAHHYSRSGNIEKAIHYLHLTGQQAAQNSAQADAVSNFTAALNLLNALPETSERVEQELTLQLALAASLQVTKGPSSPQVGEVYRRARVLCQQSGDERQLFSVLRGLWLFHHVQADLAAAREMGELLFAMAEQFHDATCLLEASRMLGSTLLWQGEFLLARHHLEHAVVFSDRQPQGSLPLSYGGADPGIVCLCELARALWFLGYPEQSMLRSQEALSRARNRSDPFSLGFALIFSAGFHQLSRDERLTQMYAEEGIELAREYGFVALLSAGIIRRGWALAEQGQGKEGLQQMQQGLSARQATGAELAQPYFLALQAEVYGKLGQGERAQTALSEALTAMRATGEQRLEAELYRLKGELILQHAGRLGKNES